MPIRIALLAVLGLLADVQFAAAETQHRMYVCLDRCVGVFDMDHDHKLLKKIAVVGDQIDPGEPLGVQGPGNFAGICASAANARLYVSTTLTDEMICVDLLSDKVLWHHKYGNRVDSMAITPTGKTIYLPCRNDGNWYVIDAMSGKQISKIHTGGSPHNTRCNRAGARMYMESLADPYIFVADTSTNQVVGKVGPFSNIIRPFSLSNDEKHLFCCVNGLLGFEIGDIESQKVIGRVVAHTPEDRLKELGNVGVPHGVPSHGIGTRPDKPEIYVADGAYGFVDVFDGSAMPPHHLASIPIFDKEAPRPQPTWISFSLDGHYCYTPGNAIIDTHSKKLIGRMPISEKMIEIDFDSGKPTQAAPRMW